MTSTRQLCALALVGAALVGASCSSDSDSSKAGSNANGEFSVANSLRQIPSVVLESDDDDSGDTNLQIAVSDLDAASEMAGVDHPGNGTTDVDEITEWLLAINGPNRGDEPPLTAAFLPEVAHADDFENVGDFDDEVGWSISDVHTFVEYQVPPNVFTVMTGGFSDDALTDAIGKPDDDIWSLGGDDFSTDFANTSAARPLGESLRFAVRDDTLAVARSTPPVEAWNALDTTKPVGTLAEDEALTAVAAALDESGVYSALLSQGDFSARAPNETPAQAEQSGSTGIGPFTTLGVGQTVEDDTPYAVFVYYFADEDAATEAVDTLTALLNDGVSDRARRPWNEAFAIRDVTATDNILKATLRLAEFSPGAVWNLVSARDNLVVSS